MAEFQEYELAAAPDLGLDARNGRDTARFFSDPERVRKSEVRACEHAARRSAGWNEIAARRVPVLGDARLPMQREEIDPVPQRRQRIARPRRVVLIEQR